MENQKKKKKKIFFFFFFFFFVKLGIFCLELEKNILFGIGNGAEFRPQNRVIESPDSRHFVQAAESLTQLEGAQWLSGRVLDSIPKGHGFEPHRRHCVVVLEQDTLILA